MIQSKRLEAICDLVPDVDVVIDVGADHGYLEELLITSGKVKKVIATDISSKSLQKTQKRAEKLGISDKIELIVADGLDFKSQSKSNFAVIAGIGGIETASILKRSLGKTKVNEFILLPVQNQVYLREFLIDNGFVFLTDKTIFEKGKFYSVIHCKLSNLSNHNNKYFGITDLSFPSEDFKRYIDRELKNLQFLDKINRDEKMQEKIAYKNMLKSLKENNDARDFKISRH